MSHMHPNTEAHPVRVFAHAGELYWCQRVPHIVMRSAKVIGGTRYWQEQHGYELRIGVLGTDEPAAEVEGLREAAESVCGKK